VKLLQGERGAAAVEFAIILPVLILLLVGIVEFGRAFQVQATLAAAAREGVRIMALEDDAAAARAATRSASDGLDPALSDANIAVAPVSCAGGAGNATVTITYRQPFLTGLFGSGVDLSARGVMRCNG
jgi:Flp pilus assembly protein TadG